MVALGSGTPSGNALVEAGLHAEGAEIGDPDGGGFELLSLSEAYIWNQAHLAGDPAWQATKPQLAAFLSAHGPLISDAGVCYTTTTCYDNLKLVAAVAELALLRTGLGGSGPGALLAPLTNCAWGRWQNLLPLPETQAGTRFTAAWSDSAAPGFSRTQRRIPSHTTPSPRSCSDTPSWHSVWQRHACSGSALTGSARAHRADGAGRRRLIHRAWAGAGLDGGRDDRCPFHSGRADRRCRMAWTFSRRRTARDGPVGSCLSAQWLGPSARTAPCRPAGSGQLPRNRRLRERGRIQRARPVGPARRGSRARRDPPTTAQPVPSQTQGTFLDPSHTRFATVTHGRLGSPFTAPTAISTTAVTDLVWSRPAPQCRRLALGPPLPASHLQSPAGGGGCNASARTYPLPDRAEHHLRRRRCGLRRRADGAPWQSGDPPAVWAFTPTAAGNGILLSFLRSGQSRPRVPGVV